MNIHFGRVVVWCGVNRRISEASIPSSDSSSIHPFLHISLMPNLLCGLILNQFRPPKHQRRPWPSLPSDSSSMPYIFNSLLFLCYVRGKLWVKSVAFSLGHKRFNYTINNVFHLVGNYLDIL